MTRFPTARFVGAWVVTMAVAVGVFLTGAPGFLIVLAAATVGFALGFLWVGRA